MFRKLRDQVTSAADAASNALGFGDDKVQTLQGMGFDAERARHALNATDGDVDRAAELLLLSEDGGATGGGRQQAQQGAARTWRGGGGGVGVGGGGGGTAASPIDVDAESDEVRRAVDASVQAEEERRVRAAQEASMGGGGGGAGGGAAATAASAAPPHGRTAAMSAAGRAAAKRFEEAGNKFGTGAAKKKKAPNGKGATKDLLQRSNTAPPTFDHVRPNDGGPVRMKSGGLTAHHPKVKVPKRLGDKSKEEQLLRCANRLAPHPAAVDTLLRALTAVRNDPANDRYRKVDKTTAGYQRTLQDKPGAEDMLLAMNFRRRGANELVLDRPMVDDALLYLGISALEKARETDEYKDGKRMAQFAKEMAEIRLGGNDSESEAVRRAGFMAKVPSEPAGGAGALLQLSIGDEVVRRRFDGDDVLRDVVNWIGGHGSAIPDKIATRDWCLVDINRYPAAPIDTEKNMDRTLQFIGCWPSGRLEVRPSSDEWREAGAAGDGVMMGSSRGLGSAPTSELH